MRHAPSDPCRSLEYCEDCERRVQHSVSIEIQAEASKDTNVKFSREPYRVAVCEKCDTATRLRMNNQ